MQKYISKKNLSNFIFISQCQNKIKIQNEIINNHSKFHFIKSKSPINPKIFSYKNSITNSNPIFSIKQFSTFTNKKENNNDNNVINNLNNCPLNSILTKNNFYEIFQIEENYIIDKKILERKYKDIQMIIHPDKFAQLDKTKLDEAHNASSLVITAYNILKDDYKRGNYLLELKGFESIAESNTIHDKEFLMDFMDKQERIDDCENKEEILIIKNEINNDICLLTNKLAELFIKNDYKECVNILNTIKFNLSLMENINNKI
jgi:molecular chaperone HscB